VIIENREIRYLREQKRQKEAIKRGQEVGWSPIIPLPERRAYKASLEKASVGENIGPFAHFLATLVEKRLAGEPLPEVPKSTKVVNHE
jgi:hypothetical protein